MATVLLFIQMPASPTCWYYRCKEVLKYNGNTTLIPSFIKIGPLPQKLGKHTHASARTKVCPKAGKVG